jgi:hypothetical protein
VKVARPVRRAAPSKRDAVDFGVNGRREEARVSEDLADLVEPGPGSQHLGRRGVAQPVGTQLDDPGAFARSGDDGGDATGGEAPLPSPDADEDLSCPAGLAGPGAATRRSPRRRRRGSAGVLPWGRCLERGALLSASRRRRGGARPLRRSEDRDGRAASTRRNPADGPPSDDHSSPRAGPHHWDRPPSATRRAARKSPPAPPRRAAS